LRNELQSLVRYIVFIMLSESLALSKVEWVAAPLE
jgi:hypothetical protein